MRESSRGKSFKPHLVINNAVSNICSLVFGHCCKYGDEKFMKLMKVFDKAVHIEDSVWAQGIMVIPSLTLVLFDKNEWETPFTFNKGHFLNKEVLSQHTQTGPEETVKERTQT
eukprot:superscaffoldBa00001099_g8954